MGTAAAIGRYFCGATAIFTILLGVIIVTAVLANIFSRSKENKLDKIQKEFQIIYIGYIAIAAGAWLMYKYIHTPKFLCYAVAGAAMIPGIVFVFTGLIRMVLASRRKTTAGSEDWMTYIATGIIYFMTGFAIMRS